MVIGPGLSVGDSCGGCIQTSLGLCRIARNLNINPLLRHGHIISAIPVAFGNSVGSVVGHIGVGDAVGSRLSRNLGRRGNVASCNLSSRGVGDGWVGSNILGRLRFASRGVLIVNWSGIVLREYLDLRVCQRLAGAPNGNMKGVPTGRLELLPRYTPDLVAGSFKEL